MQRHICSYRLLTKKETQTTPRLIITKEKYLMVQDKIVSMVLLANTKLVTQDLEMVLITYDNVSRLKCDCKLHIQIAAFFKSFFIW